MLKQTLLSLTFLTAFLGMNTVAHAEQLPKVAANDPRIQYFDYDPNTVYIVNTKVGYSSLIQFDKGEEIEDNGGLGMGDAKAWSLAVKGNNVFFKPVAEMPDTNMVIVTNKHTYAFQLTTGGGNQTYIARFRYPDDTSKTASTTPKPTALPPTLQEVTNAKGQKVLIDADYNSAYVYRGDALIKPTNVWDNGRFTYLRFAHAGDLPTAYRVLPDKTESLVNSHIEGDTLVLQEVGYVYRLRFGKAVGDIGNKRAKLPTFNTAGTSEKNYIRIDQ